MSKDAELASDDVMSILSQSMRADDDTGEQTGDNTGDTPEAQGDENDPDLEPYDPDHPLYKEEPGDEADDDPESDDDPEPDSEPEPDQEPDNDKERYQYWQSRHDKLKAEKENELQTYKQRLDQMEQRLQQMASGGGENQGQRPKTIDDEIAERQQSLQSLDTQVPTAPDKPADYNEQDAYTDPDSASFRYQRQLESYNAKVTENLRQRDKIKDELYELKMKKLEEPVNQVTAERQMSRQKQAMVDTLQKNYKLSNEEASDFINIMSDPKSLSLDNLVNYYKFQKGMASSSSSKSPKPSGKPNRQPKKTVAAPPPAKGGSGGTGTDSPDEHDAFSKALLTGTDMF